jgi:asparaginyl-tRNA synthetase
VDVAQLVSFPISLNDLMNVAIKDLSQYVNQTVTLQGWLYNQRSKGKILFLVIRDGSGICQCVLAKNAETEPFFAAVEKLGQESSLRVTGLVKANEKQEGGCELEVSGVEIVGLSEGYPITPKPHGIDFLMRHRHLHFRSRRTWAILRVRHTLIDEIRNFFNRQGFTLIDTPIFAPAAGEGSQTLFKADYFGEPVALAQTGQLYLEPACMAFGKTYCFGPTFRAEKSKSRRHLTEFWMVEPEVAWCDLAGITALAEDFICSLVTRVLRDCRSELEFLGVNLPTLEGVQKPFYRLTYTEAAEILRGPRAKEFLERDLEQKQTRISELEKLIQEKEKLASTGQKWQADKAALEVADHREELSDLKTEVTNIPHHLQLAAGFEWGKDLGGSDETIISRLHDRPIFVTHYPRDCKAFYMKKNATDGRVVNNFDLLAHNGYGEIIGGSQREDDLQVLLERIHEEHLKPEEYDWYLDLRRYGTVPHSGFGLGVERTVAWLCGLKHIRETIPYARMLEKMYP